jgi:hypothetical protein
MRNINFRSVFFIKKLLTDRQSSEEKQAGIKK